MAKRRGSSRIERTTEIGRYLTRIRVRQRKTQQEISEKMGRDKSFICRIETGQRAQNSLRGYILYQIAEAYGAPIAKVLKEANWTQLLLVDTTEEERKQLIRYLNKIRRQKNKDR